METKIRQIDALSDISGMSVNEITQLAVGAGNASAAMGGPRSVGLSAAMGAAAFGAGFGSDSAALLGSNITKQELIAKDALLRGQAGASVVGQQMATVLRMGEEGQLTKGTEAYRMYQAIKAGKSTYDGDKQVFKTDRSEWKDILATGSGMTRGEISAEYSNESANQLYRGGATTAARRAQYEVSVRRNLDNSVSSSLRQASLDPDDARDLTDELMDWSPAEGANQVEARIQERKFQEQMYRDAGMNAKQAQQASSRFSIALSNEALKLGPGATSQQVREAHSRNRLDAGDAMRRRGNFQAGIARAFSYIGRKGPAERILELFAEGGADTEPMDFMKALMNDTAVQDIGKMGPDGEAFLESFKKVQKLGSKLGADGEWRSDADQNAYDDELKKMGELGQKLGIDTPEEKAKQEEREAALKGAMGPAPDPAAAAAADPRAATDVRDDPANLAGKGGGINIAIAQLTIHEDGSAELTADAARSEP